MKRLLLSAAAFVVIAGSALAHDDSHPSAMPMATSGSGMEMMAPSPGDSAATAGYKSAMMKMMTSMPKFSGDADVDFMKQMRGHHQAAIDMAKVVLANGKDAETKALARKIISAQEKEIKTIDAWLKKKGT